MTIEGLISAYGYLAVGIGTFLEGETTLVLGGFAAHRGYLELPWVILCAFIGTLLGDQFFFYLGRAKGRDLLERRPSWRAKSERVFSWLLQREIWLILGFRFLYGFRTVTPFIIGASGISRSRYLVLSAFGAFVWSTVVGVAGYLFGHTLDALLGDVKRYELWVFAMLAVVGLTIWLTFWWRRTAGRRRVQSAATRDEADK